MKYKLEICANSVVSCIEAQKGGACRVELCAGIPEGGTTPSYGDIFIARKHLDIKLNIIIRPRSGDFLYSDLEHKTMLADITNAVKLGVDGIVIGCLTAKGDVDMIKNKELIDAAENLNVTFHRAFDMSRDPYDSLEKIISLGCDRILTSGMKPKAEEGIPLIKDIIDKAKNRIIIMPGSGINENNISKIAQQTGALEFHLSARESVDSLMEYKNPNVSMGGINININEYKQDITNSSKIINTLNQLKK